jgi:dipeptidyl aminopeptidase/acylaminoacyl peptidase
LDASGNLVVNPEPNLTQEGSGVAASTDVNPDFSPDGSKIVFDGTRDGNRDIYVVDVASKAVTRLTTDPALEYEPTFSPDGEQIAFVREVSGDQEIFRMDAQPGAIAENISENPGPDRNPEWGPASTAPASTAPASTAPASTSPSPSESSLGIAIPVLMISIGAVFARRRKRL